MPKPYNPHDKLMIKAKREGYRARSIFKLMELDQRFHLLHQDMRVLDIGAAPGSWLQYTSEKIGVDGLALGLDIQPIKPIAANVETYICDIVDEQQVEQSIHNMGWQNVDLILSDIAPNTSGIAHADHTRSVELNRHIFSIAQKYLKPNGTLVMKLFPGTLLNQFVNELKTYFRHVHQVRVQATRDRSNEVYVVCKS